MNNLLSNWLRRVIRVKIDGTINQKLSDRISNGLKRAMKYKAEAVIVVVNSSNGSLAQAKYISHTLKQFGAQKNTPIYCFVEDQCLGSANVILTSGVKCYANSMSMIGDFGYSWNSLWLKKFADKYNIKAEYIHGGSNKVKFNPYEDIKPESQKWMQNYLYALEHDLKVSVIDNREEHFKKREGKLEKNDIEEKLFKGLIIEPKQAVQMGYLDGIMNYDDLIKEKFSSVKVHDVIPKQRSDKFAHFLSELRLDSIV